MKCRRFEKWISDSLDGALSEKKKERLDAHLKSCAHCQAYKNRMLALQGEAGHIALEEQALAPEHWHGFSDRLQARLAAADQEYIEKKSVRRIRGLGQNWVTRNWRWAAASGFAAAAVVLAILVLPPFIVREPAQYYVFSLEETLAQVDMEMGTDLELEAAFNSLLQTAIETEVENIDLGIEPVYWENPLEYEDLSQEELLYLEAEIRKEIKS